MKRIEQKSDLLNFTIFHNEFIETEILNGHEKLVFMAIKRHLNEKTNKSFPSLSTISRYSRLSKSTVQKTLRSLKDKEIIKIEHRQDNKNNRNKSNEYTLYDYKTMWTSTNKEEIKQAIEQEQEEKNFENLPTETLQRKLKEIQRILERRDKEKGLGSGPTTVQNQAPKNISNISKDTIKGSESQVERYTLDQIRQLFDYDAMVNDHPCQRQDIDIVMDILHTAMNTTKPTIRISGEDKPAMMVIGKLMKLDKESIIYAIKKFSEQTGRIKNPISYMLTILYSAPEQFSLDIQNQVSHDMADRP